MLFVCCSLQLVTVSELWKDWKEKNLIASEFTKKDTLKTDVVD